MKLAALVIALTSLFSLSAFAENVTTQKEKVVCMVEVHTKIYDAAGMEIDEAEYSGKSSEGGRTVWTKDGVTYKFSEMLNYSFSKMNEGPWTNEVNSQTKTFSKMTKTEKDGLISYIGDSRSVKMYLKETSQPKISDKTFTFEETYSLVGDQEVLVYSVYDGKEEPVWISNQAEIKIDDHHRVVTETYQVPHYSYDQASKTTYVDLKNVRICSYEKID